MPGNCCLPVCFQSLKVLCRGSAGVVSDLTDCPQPPRRINMGIPVCFGVWRQQEGGGAEELGKSTHQSKPCAVFFRRSFLRSCCETILELPTFSRTSAEVSFRWTVDSPPDRSPLAPKPNAESDVRRQMPESGGDCGPAGEPKIPLEIRRVSTSLILSWELPSSYSLASVDT